MLQSITRIWMYFPISSHSSHYISCNHVPCVASTGMSHPARIPSRNCLTKPATTQPHVEVNHPTRYFFVCFFPILQALKHFLLSHLWPGTVLYQNFCVVPLVSKLHQCLSIFQPMAPKTSGLYHGVSAVPDHGILGSLGALSGPLESSIRGFGSSPWH